MTRTCGSPASCGACTTRSPATARERWQDEARLDVRPPDGSRIGLGFDGSITTDASALIGCTPDGHLFEIGVWERPENAPADWRVPRTDVRAVLRETFRRFD